MARKKPGAHNEHDQPLANETISRQVSLGRHSVDQARLDEMIDRATKMSGAPRFISQYQPQARWLWWQWQGTVMQQTWRPAITMMLVGAVLTLLMEIPRNDGENKWSILEEPSPNDRWVAKMKGFTTMWGYLLTMATFVNSFFLSQAYGFWLATKGNCRKVQGRLNDMGMLVATHAERDAMTGKFTPTSQDLLDTIARWSRLFHMLFWAGQVKHPARSGEAVPFSMLRTELGLSALLARKLITEREYALLVDNARLSETQRHYAVIQWIVARFVDARQSGVLNGGTALEARFLEEACKLRATCASIADDAVARMPLSYVHLVQILVDTLVVLAPFALYPKLGVLTPLLSFFLVIFYRGFLQLSKSLLDPFGNDDLVLLLSSENFSIECLLGELNESSVRWFHAIEELPFKPSSASSAKQLN